jgi:hypothetical protein
MYEMPIMAPILNVEVAEEEAGPLTEIDAILAARSASCCAATVEL